VLQGLRIAALAGAALLAMPAVAQAPAPAALDADLKRFIAWFGGEWNNHEQVWQQKVESAKLPGGKPDDPIAHTHHIFAPVAAPKIGAHTYYVQQSLDADMSKAYRQRLYRITADAASNAVKLEIFSFPDEKAFFNAHLKPELFTALETSMLRAVPGCEVYWRFQPQAKEFIGTMIPNACSFVSQRLGKRIIITDTLKLSESEIWINDQARDEQGGHVFGSKTDTPVKNRRVRYFTGWAFGKEPATGRALQGKRDVMIHNEGHTVPLMWDDGSASPYQIELAQLTYQNTSVPILKLSLVDKSSNKTVAYTWANTDASRIGLNLGWIQFGLTLKTGDPSYGFAAKAP
jgi:CpeT/CpcT family (DUF1001)